MTYHVNSSTNLVTPTCQDIGPGRTQVQPGLFRFHKSHWFSCATLFAKRLIHPAMNCPNCAAALDLIPGRTQLRCPYCTSLVFPEPLADGIVVLNQDHELRCPVCVKTLHNAAIDGLSVGYCVDCRGILLANDQLAAIVNRRREEGPTSSFREPIDPRELRRKIQCPQCGRRAEAHPYGAGGNAIIDSCERCHLVWLDAGELTMLGKFAPSRTGRSTIWDAASAVNFPTDAPADVF